MEDELAERYNKLDSHGLPRRVRQGGAAMALRDCHRSQYGYPFRVGIQLALENRHRAVTFASFSCSGAEIAYGLFVEMDAREGYSDPAVAKVRPQLDQLADLICRGARHPAGQLHAADVFGRQHLDHAAADQQDLVSRRRSASARSTSC